jgi:lysozyme
MRPHGVLLFLGVCLVAGCTSSGNVDDLVPRPSSEVTSSIGKPEAPTPAEDVASAADEESEVQETVVEAEPAGAQASLGDGIELPAETVALVAPAKPAPAVAAIERNTIYQRKFRDAKPINFGKSSPRKLAVHGVDVSRWQGNIDWAKLRGQGANFAYIKATDGGDHLDPMFKKNWRAAHSAGLKRGAYHFFYWCRTAGDQADWFIRNVPRVEGALPPVIDVEWNGESSCKRRPSAAKVREKMQVFMDRLEAHYGQRPIIYTSPDFYRDNLKGAFPNHPFWLRSVARHPAKTYPGRKWVFWQYSGSGLSQGVRGRIDLNVFHGSEDEWHQWVAGTQG